MTDFKRNVSEISLDIQEDHKKHQHNKPGRKPTETEPKSKRTAQNRAAQRAYRERKEKRMQDLEDKVKSLEDRNVKAHTETDFLKAQVNVLKQELARYRGTSDFSDLNLPTTVGHLLKPNQPSSSLSGSLNSISSLNTYGDKGSTGFLSSNHTTPENYNNSVAVEFPWSKNNLSNAKKNFQLGGAKNATQNSLPDLVGGGGGGGSTSSSLTSPLNDQLVSPESSENSVYHASTVSLVQPFEHLDFGIKFEENIDPFCQLLDEACGTKECPVPKYKATPSTDSPFAQLSDYRPSQRASQGSINFINDPFFNGEASELVLPQVTSNQYNSEEYPPTDPLLFLGDDGFDISMALGNSYGVIKKEQDPLAALTTEDSVYDQFVTEKKTADPVDVSEYFDADTAKNTKDANDDEDDEVVPAPEETVRCSEIWDRITSHPKYTDIDIDLLCSELKQKAKCSEKGVVINSSDVNKLLEKLIRQG